MFCNPSAASSTIRARLASPCAVRRRPAKSSSSARSPAVNSIATADLPIVHPPQDPTARSYELMDQDTSVVPEIVGSE
jgi:hypothetical protein